MVDFTWYLIFYPWNKLKETSKLPGKICVSFYWQQALCTVSTSKAAVCTVFGCSFYIPHPLPTLLPFLPEKWRDSRRYRRNVRYYLLTHYWLHTYYKQVILKIFSIIWFLYFYPAIFTFPSIYFMDKIWDILWNQWHEND